MTDLRKHAKDEACMVRIPGICNGNRETTVLAHLRMAGITGGAQKAPDLLAAWCCSSCHDYVDGRTGPAVSSDLRQVALLEGIMRTQYELIHRKIVKW